jgi:hypothetical protein
MERPERDSQVGWPSSGSIGPSDESSKAPELGLKPPSAFGSATYCPFGIRRQSVTSSEIVGSSMYGGSAGMMRRACLPRRFAQRARN